MRVEESAAKHTSVIGEPAPVGRIAILFSDIEDSTPLASSLGGPVYYERLLAPHNTLLRRLLATHHGHEVSTAGDSFFVVFQRARSALAFAVAVQQELRDRPLSYELRGKSHDVRVRMGIHVSREDMEPTPEGDYIGPDVNFASRVAGIALGGQILLSESARETIPPTPDGYWQSWPQRRLKGFDEAAAVWEALWAKESRGEPGSRWLPAWFSGHQSPYVWRSRLEGHILGCLARTSPTSFSPRIITIHGAGGMGKTRLAIACATKAADLFKDGVFLVELADKPRTQQGLLEAMNNSLARAGLAASSPLEDFLHVREALFVLDNYESVKCCEAGDWLAQLSARCAGIRLLVASQEPVGVEGAEQLISADEGMSPDEAQALLTRLIAMKRPAEWLPAVGESHELRRICSLTEHSPLALQLAAAWTSRRTLKEIADDLTFSALGATSSQPEGTRGLRQADRHRSLERCADWSLSLLDVAERDSFVRLGVFRGDFDAATVRRVCNIDQPQKHLDRFVDAALVYRDTEGRYGMHRFLREHANRAFEGHPDREAIELALIAATVEDARTSAREPGVPAGLNLATPNIMRAAELAGSRTEHATVIELSKLLGGTLQRLGLSAEREQLALRALESSKIQGHPVTVGWCYCALAEVHRRQNRWKECEEEARLSVGLLRKPTAKARARSTLAEALSHLGRAEEAITVARASVEQLYGPGEKESQAIALEGLAELYRRHGRRSEAQRANAESARLRVEVGEQRNLASNYSREGRMLFAVDPAAAERRLLDGLKLAREAADDAREAWLLKDIAEARRLQGAYEEALEALRLSAEINNSPSNRAFCESRAGRILRIYGKLPAARARLEAAIDLYQQIQDAMGMTIALTWLGDLLVVMQAFDDADSAYRRAIDAAPSPFEESRARGRLGVLLMRQGRTDEANRYFTESEMIARRSNDPSQVAWCLQQRANVRVAIGQPAEAIELLKTAIVVLREAGLERDLVGAEATLESWEGGRLGDPSLRSEYLRDYAQRLIPIRRVVTSVTRYGGLADAQRELERIGEEADQAGDMLLRGIVLNELGSVLRKRNRLPEARSALLRGFELLSGECENLDGAAASLHKLGKLFHREATTLAQEGRQQAAMRSFVEAEEAFRSCLRLKATLNDAIGRAITLSALAETYAQIGELDQADTICNEALSLVQAGTRKQQQMQEQQRARIRLLRQNGSSQAT